MDTRRIPGTGLDVSTICLGTMTFGRPVAEPEAVKLVHYALDKGINLVDTANMYEGYDRAAGSPGGVAEEILGKAMAGRREEAIIATKVGMKVGDALEDEGTSPAAIRKHLDLGLRRLRTEYVDILYLHRPDPEVRMLDVLDVLSRTMQEGKIRHYGVSNFSAEELSALLACADGNGLPRPVVAQPGMSLLKKDACADVLPLCECEGIAVAPYQVLQGGLLTGRYWRGAPPPPGSRKAEADGWVWDLTDELFDRLETISAEADAQGSTMVQYALRWTLDQPAVVSAIVGARRPEHIDEAVSVTG